MKKAHNVWLRLYSTHVCTNYTGHSIRIDQATDVELDCPWHSEYFYYPWVCYGIFFPLVVCWILVGKCVQTILVNRLGLIKQQMVNWTDHGIVSVF